MFAFYWPMAVYGPYLALRLKHPCFFTPINPALEAGGMGMESKSETLEMLPEAYCPKSVFVPQGMSSGALGDALDAADLQFPLIVKPDIGFRGRLVAKVSGHSELINYIAKYPLDFIVQEFLDYPEEVGVFYFRMPGEEKGQVISLTLKEFLFVEGDGDSTLRELIEQKPRALLQLERLEDSHGPLLDEVPNQGQQVPLGEIGNHNKGTTFINGNDQIDQRLNDFFNNFCKGIEGFYYGRFDIKCKSLESLKEGQDFKIIEMNGVFSEPTHIYDASQMTYFEALRTIMRHWKMIQEAASRNYQQGVAPMPFMDMMKVLKGIRDYGKLMKKMG